MQGDMTFDLEELEECMESQSGLCTKCGEQSSCCEPDARDYLCECCGENAVYGAEELIVMGCVS